jgi:hypothetical protein
MPVMLIISDANDREVSLIGLCTVERRQPVIVKA